MKQIAFLPFFLILATACSERYDLIVSDTSTEDSDISGITDTGIIIKEIRSEVTTNPDSIRFYRKERLLFSIDYSQGGFFYLISKDNTKITFRFDTVNKLGDKTTISLLSESGDKYGSVEIDETDPTSPTMIFAVRNRLNTEKTGISFNITKDEGFYGLMERVVQGDQDNSWQEGMKEGFNLRGQDVYLYTYPTISIYSPFFTSSNLYGMYIMSSWP